jgi:hypothetical protein
MLEPDAENASWKRSLVSLRYAAGRRRSQSEIRLHPLRRDLAATAVVFTVLSPEP